MSAYSVQKESIENLATTICDVVNFKRNYVYYNLHELEIVLTDCKSGTYRDMNQKKVCRKLRELNNQAVNDSIVENYSEGKNLLRNDKFQLLKSLQCFLYQCDEDSTHSTELFKALKIFEEQIKDDIIRNLSEYENAEWK